MNYRLLIIVYRLSFFRTYPLTYASNRVQLKIAITKFLRRFYIMKMRNLLILPAILVFLPAIALADTETVTPTITETPTATITETVTVSPTETTTFTITPTYTITPSPQATIFAYPNPAAYRDSMAIAYPSKTGADVDFLRVVITIYAVNGDFVARIIDDKPNGYTTFDIRKLARGTYIYKLEVRYKDGTSETYKYKKFAVIK